MKFLGLPTPINKGHLAKLQLEDGWRSDMQPLSRSVSAHVQVLVLERNGMSSMCSSSAYYVICVTEDTIKNKINEKQKKKMHTLLP